MSLLKLWLLAAAVTAAPALAYRNPPRTVGALPTLEPTIVTAPREDVPKPLCLGGMDVTVTPCSTRSSTAGQVDSVTFTVTSLAATVQDYELSCSATKAVASCTSRAPTLTMEQNSPQYVTVVFTPSVANGTGRVSLRARNIADNDEATGWYDVTVTGGVTYDVNLTADAPTQSPPPNTRYSASFTIENGGTAQAIYLLSAACSGAVTACTVR